MQFSFLHFKLNACFSYHPDTPPPFQSSTNHLLAQHLRAVAAGDSSGPGPLPEEAGSWLQGGPGPVALLSEGLCLAAGQGFVQGTRQPLHKAPAIRTEPSPAGQCPQPASAAVKASASLQSFCFLLTTKAYLHPALLGVMGSIIKILLLLEDCYVSLLKELKLLKPLLNFQ